VKAAAKKWIKTALKLAVCAGAVWYLSTKVTLEDYAYRAGHPDEKVVIVEQTPDSIHIRDHSGNLRRIPRSDLATSEQVGDDKYLIELGLKSALRNTDLGWAGWALLVFAPVTFIVAWRLRLLLTTQGILLTIRDAILLTFAGNFFNFAMPGTTGGDLYKAYHIAKRTHKRTEGITVVLLDRVIGLISFLILAAGALAVSWQKQMIGEYGRWVGYLMIAMFVGACLFFSRRVRRRIRYDDLLRRFPMGDKLRRIDETAFNLRFHLRKTIGALAMTLVAHFFFITSVYCLARGLNIPPRPDFDAGDLYLAILLACVVGYLFAAIPISIQGFGLLEAVFFRVLVRGDWCSPSQMLALTLGARLLQIIWALPGIIVPWMGLKRPPGDSSGGDFRDADQERVAMATPESA
jgi:uncharacterized membrane protein YbhN (UPF0104 family)